MKTKSLLFVWLACLFFLLTFSLSFIKNNTKENRKPLKTSLLNSKNISKINYISLNTENKELVLNKNSFGLWEVCNNTDGKLIGNQNRINSFITDLSKIINVYKISDKNNENPAYGLNDNSQNRFLLTYCLDEGGITALTFGNYDFSENYRYFSNNNTTVYEISKEIDKYLTTSIQAWSESEIINKEILNSRNFSDIQRVVLKNQSATEILTSNTYEKYSDYVSDLLELRHGGFPTLKTISEIPETTLILEFGDKTALNIYIFPTEEDNEYVLFLNYEDTINKKSHNYCMKISSWTYNKIKTNRL